MGFGLELTERILKHVKVECGSAFGDHLRNLWKVS